MSSFKFNETEWEVTCQDPVLWTLYCAIRKHMDFKTGIAGKKRRLSSRYFEELLHQPASQGKPEIIYTRDQVKRLCIKLEKLGAIRRLGNFIFECILADKDKSVPEKCAHLAPIPGPISEPGSEPKNNNSNELKNKGKRGLAAKKYAQRLDRKKAHKYPPRCALPPVPVNNINNTLVQTDENDPVQKPKRAIARHGSNDEAFMRFWKAYPRKQKRKKACEIWTRDKLVAMVDTILVDLEMRKRSAEWMRDEGRFIPMPSSYLTQERWNDEGDGNYSANLLPPLQERCKFCDKRVVDKNLCADHIETMG